jgi:branched-chain amino acid transport system ATP-binding protein
MSHGLWIENAEVGYGDYRVIRSLSIRFEEGEFVSLIGPNGAGKTTLLSAISGQIPLMNGRIMFDGQDITKWPVDRRAKAGIGRSYQITHVFPNLSVLENVKLAVNGRRGVGLKDLVRFTGKQTEQAALRYIEMVELSREAMKPARLLSHGDKRKLEIAMLLALEPKVLLLDEPTAGMSVNEVPAMLNLLQNLRSQGRYFIVLVEHKLDVVMSLSDRIVVLQQGALLAEGSPKQVLENPVVQSAYLGGI